MQKTKFVVCFTVLMLVLALGLVCARNIKPPSRQSGTRPNCAIFHIANVSLWEDRECVLPLIGIEWMPMHPGERKNFTVWARSESPIPVRLNISAQISGVPRGLEEYLLAECSYKQSVLQPKEALEVTCSVLVKEGCPLPKVGGLTVEIYIIPYPVNPNQP